MTNNQILILGFSIISVMTALGSAVVYFFKDKISEKVNTIFLGFASGVMIAASVWSLLLPALDQAESSGIYGKFSFIPVAIGFIIGGLFLVIIDKIIPHFHKGTDEEEGPKNSLKKSTKLFLAVTIHNVPEGLAVGFAFGAAALVNDTNAYLSALALAIGLGIQNFPEGAAVALPMKESLNSKHKAFLFGAASGIVEPIAAVLGFFLATVLTSIQPWLLAFSAGAMIFVVAEDLIPDAKLETHPHLGTFGVMIGFVIMMILDVALG